MTRLFALVLFSSTVILGAAACEETPYEPGRIECLEPPAQSDADDFTKPQQFEPWRDIRHAFDPSDQREPASDGGSSSRAWAAHEYMRPSHDRNDLWLHPGEHAVIDLGWQWSAAKLPERLTYDVMVFVDMVPVEFGLIEADPDPAGAPLPTLEEAVEYAPLKKRVRVESEQTEPLVLTVVIPPNSFDEVGAHDVRIAFVPDNSDRGFEYGIPVLGGTPGFAFTVNYGGTEFVHEPSPGVDESVVYPPDEVGAYLSRPNVFLKPPIAAGELGEADLSKLFVVDDETISLRGWVENTAPFDIPNSRTVIALDGDRRVGEPVRFALPNAPSGLGGYRQTKQPYAGQFDIDVPIDDGELHQVRAFAFSDRNCRMRSPFRDGVSASNVVFVGWAP